MRQRGTGKGTGSISRTPPEAAPRAASGPGDQAPLLPVHGFQGTPDEVERQWYAEVYLGRGDRMPQLTWRAVLMGSALGGVLSVTNLYIGLKAGWGFGVAITACILSYAIWTALHRAGIARTPMTILEDLGPVKLWSIAAGGLVGIALTVLARIFPGREHLIPSPAGVGLAWTFHWYYGRLSFAGGALGWWLEKRHPAWAEEFTFPVASRWIAGESLTGVLLVGWEHGPELLRRLIGR